MIQVKNDLAAEIECNYDEKKYEELRQLTQFIQRLCELQLRHYLINSSDVRYCPDSACGYAGTIILNPDTDRIDCTKPFTCNKCSKEWRDPLQQEPSRSLSNFSPSQFVRGLFPESLEATANNLRLVMIASPCPNCGVFVQKNGGCPHMRCFKCDFEYCWICMGHYRRYRHDKGQEVYCGQALMVYSFLYFALGLILMGKIAQFPCFYSDKFPTNPLKYMYEHTTGIMALRFVVDFILSKGVIFAIYLIVQRLIQEIGDKRVRPADRCDPKFEKVLDKLSGSQRELITIYVLSILAILLTVNLIDQLILQILVCELCFVVAIFPLGVSFAALSVVALLCICLSSFAVLVSIVYYTTIQSHQNVDSMLDRPITNWA